MNTTLYIANSPVLWGLALLSISIVLWQTWIFFNMAKKYSNDTGILTDAEIKKALKIGVIGTIGPAVAVFAVAIVLMGLIGGPITLARVGLIGSATFESIAASAGSDGTLGSDAFSLTLLATASWVMVLGGSGWLVSVLLITKKLDTAQEKVNKTNPKRMRLIGTITPFIVFFVMGYAESTKKIMAESPSFGTLFAMLTGGVTMYIIHYLSSTNPRLNWLREWGMGFAIIAAIIVGATIDQEVI